MNGQSIGKILYIARKGKEGYEKTLKECADTMGLTKQEVDILLILDHHDQFNHACDIVNCRGISKAYVSKAITSLVQKKLVEVDTDDFDRRYQHITLSKNAIQIIAYMKKRELEAFDKITSGIDKEDLKVFMKVIDQMTLNIKKVS